MTPLEKDLGTMQSLRPANAVWTAASINIWCMPTTKQNAVRSGQDMCNRLFFSSGVRLQQRSGCPGKAGDLQVLALSQHIPDAQSAGDFKLGAPRCTSQDPSAASI